MAFPGSRSLAVLFCAAFVAGMPAPALAQAPSSEQKPADQQKGSSEAGRNDATRRSDEIAEAGRILIGPAANPECVWFGRRVVSLLSRDDLDTAFRHLDLYDRFGCPGAHIQAAFRCLVRQGNIDPKAPETLNTRVHSCWINPAMLPSPPTASAPAAQAAPPSGTTAR